MSLLSRVQNKNLYIFLLSFQIIDLINLFVIGSLIKQKLLDIPNWIHLAIQLSVIFSCNIIAMIFVRRFVENNLTWYLFLCITFASIVLMGFIQGQNASVMDASSFKSISLLAFGLQIITLSIILGVCIKDIFNSNHDLLYSLTGATSIFILIGTVFGCIFIYMETLSPGLMNSPAGVNKLQYCLNYSFFVISGQDPPFEPANVIIRNISIFESIFSNLYAVIVVGKLFVKQEK